MYIEKNTKIEILKRMKENVPSDIDKSEGSFIHDALSPAAIETERRYTQLDDLLSKTIPQWSSGQYLDLHAEARGVYRKAGTPATAKITVTGEAGAIVKKGTIMQTTKGLRYATTEEVILGNTGKETVTVNSVEIGNQYNVSANTITILPIKINGIFSVTNEEAARAGSDTETDEELRSRFLERVKNPPSSGNCGDYVRWAKEVDGVKNVKVISLWNGPGTVKIICCGEKGASLDDEILNEVKSHIDPISGKGEGVAPVGAEVTIVTTKPKKIDVMISGLVSKDVQTAKVNMAKNLQAFFNNTNPGQTIKLKQVEGILIQTQLVDDFNSIQLNGSEKNIEITDEEIAVLGDIILAAEPTKG